ncbi:MFS transporter [Ramlibacter alkalitolerans]|uniref:MFS transporter n=1 Tax=Ramlibacter alkalitolerans TaxID=2039631 RepID=A0ABS1JKS2_9BURK|nr:MFS transporter [Ramlibacter alkalitolerans]MBL0424781.1 MFS transporter [Ramlibacter alkalitolerans]
MRSEVIPSSPALREPLPAVLWPLLFGNFVIGTGVMAVPGTLDEISRDLAVSVSTAGQLISAGALLMCVGAPLCASVVAGWDRRLLLSLSMLWYAALHLACAFAPGFASLLPLRVLALVPPAIFTPQAAASLGLLVPLGQRGRAITFIFLGWSLASVVGMPLSALVGGTLGWRSAMVLVAALSVLSAAWVWRALPTGVKPPALSFAAWQQTLRSRPLMIVVSVTVLSAAGQFVLFSYMAPYFRQKLGLEPGALSLYFLCFGAFGLAGNVLMTRHIDRIGAARCVMIGLALMAASFVLFPLGVSLPLAMLVTVPWALGCFSTNSAQQARLVGMAPDLASATVALNSSAMYAGQAVGAAAGGWLIARGGMDSLHWAGVAGVLAAMAASTLASRFASAKH